MVSNHGSIEPHVTGLNFPCPPKSGNSANFDHDTGVKQNQGLPKPSVLLLKLTNFQHRPWQRRKNHATLIESAESLAKSITPEQFEDLQDCMMMDGRILDIDASDGGWA